MTREPLPLKIPALIAELKDTANEPGFATVLWGNGDIPVILLALRVLQKIYDSRDNRLMSYIEAERHKLGL